MLLEGEEILLWWGLDCESEVDERPSHERAEKLGDCLVNSGFSSTMDLSSL